MYFDHVQFSLATGLRFDFPVRLSGIYFRPSFYYRSAGAAPSSARTVVDDVQKRTLLRLALRNPHLAALFSLDPFAVRPIERLGTPARVVHLPEPFEATVVPAETPDQTRSRLGVEAGRQVLLLFGSLDPRKGVLQVLEALRGLPDVLARGVCLVMAGEITAGRQLTLKAVADLRCASGVQVVHRDAFISDPTELHRLFRAASLVLMPYQRHVGSSNVLVRAAAAGVPVLGPNYGMLGTLIQERRLGLTVDAGQPADITRGLAQFLDPSEPYPFDADAARAYAAANTDEEMASTLFRHALAAT